MDATRSSFYLIFRWTAEQMRKRGLHIPGEAWRKDILLGAELVPRLAHDRVDHVQAGDLVLAFALLDELFHTLHHMLVELDRLHSTARDRGHFGLRYRWFRLIEPGKLRRE